MQLVISLKKSKMSTIVIANQKGGVGKTTTAINVATYLADLGKRVLLVDLDPQGNSTSGLGIDKEGIENCLYDILINDYLISDIKLDTQIPNLGLVPASVVLAAAEVELVKEFSRENRLKDAIEKIKNDYDYIIIDSPPSLGLLTINGLVAADHIIIPAQSEYFALEGLAQLLHTVQRVKTHLNKSLNLLGVVITMYDKRTLLSKEVEEELNKHFPGKVFEAIIPRSIRLAEAPSHGKSILEYDDISAGAKAYKKLAEEVLNKCHKVQEA